MKTFLATTAIAVIVSSGAYAASHEAETDTMAPAAEGTMTDSMVTPEPMAEPVENAAEDTIDAADETMEAPADSADTSADMPLQDGATQLMNANVTADQLTGASVFGTNDEDIGEIREVVLDDQGVVDQIIIEVGGFLGLGAKAVAVDFADVTIMQNADGADISVSIPQTEEQLEQLPVYDAQM